jgi:hypothetical protein
LYGESVVAIESEGEASEGDKEYLYDDDSNNYDEEDGVFGDACEDIELNSGKGTSSWSLRALMKLKICIMTNALNTKVKCRE